MNEGISLGNVLTIISIVFAFAVHLGVMSNKMTKHAAESEMRMENFEKTVGTIISACTNCYLKKKYEEMDLLVSDIKTKQDNRIVELPLQLDKIWTELRRLNDSISILLKEK